MDYSSYRQIIKADLWDKWGSLELDQQLGRPMPPLQKPYPSGSTLIDLISPASFAIGEMPLIDAMRERHSVREYKPI
ncbi:MAG TPA: hypothetical protein VF893_05725, partial [Candidatus Bathyarchaeia archaeon]